MKKQDFLKILRKFNDGSASEEEKSFLSAYYNLFEAKPDITKMLDPGKLDQLKKQIKAGIDTQIAGDIPHIKPRHSVFRRFAAAAVLIILLGAGVIFYLLKAPSVKEQHYAGQVIPPGGNKAILTLANGTRVILNNAKNGVLTLQNGTVIKKTRDGQLVYDASAAESKVAYNTISTPRGGQYRIILPDSSEVYLNAASSLRFPTAFTGSSRGVVLTGEAYFEVSHNKNKPFRVSSGSETVEVLGTHFAINAYTDEQLIKTTLLEGKVKVTIPGKTVTLNPGEQSQVLLGTHADTLINVIQNANLDEAVAWKNGYFQFENADLQTIMRQFSRWYDVKVVYEGRIGNRLFSGQIHRDLDARQALELLNYADVHFYVDGKKIIVSQ